MGAKRIAAVLAGGADLSMSAIAAFGGAHLDRRGRISGATAPGASNPGTWFEEAGGGALNAARNLARLGHVVRLVSPRGGDEIGECVAEAADAAGVIDCPVTFLDRQTPSYTAILERDGNLVVALADMDLYAQFSARRLMRRGIRDIIAASGTILMDANLPGETLAALAKAAGLQRIAAGIAISPAKVLRFRPCLASINFLFMNRAEARALAGNDGDVRSLVDTLARLGLKGGVITQGAGPAVAFQGSRIVSVQPPPIDAVSDVTGAGDALAAGFLSVWIAGADLGEALRAGVAAAGITVRSPFAACETLSRAVLYAALALVPNAE